jgi:hypothetical protein
MGLRIIAPRAVLTPALRETLSARPELLPVVSRLEGMRATAGRLPIPCARLEPCGGSGRCFSCGDHLDHLQAHGRCVPCAVAAVADSHVR